MPWITTDFPTQLELDSCVTCGLCLPHCPTFRITGKETASPRGRLAAMAAVGDGLLDIDDTFESIMGNCLQCRACEAACPSLVPFGRAMEGTRIEIATQRPDRVRKVRSRLYDRVLTSRPALRLASLGAAVGQRVGAHRIGPGRRLAGLRRLPLRSASVSGTVIRRQGGSIGTAAVLSGCVMDVWFADVHRATIELLSRGGYDVVVPETQTCCGALAAHDGDAATTRRVAAVNVAAFADADVIVADAAGCGAHLADYGHWVEGGADMAARVLDVTVVVARLIDQGRLPTIPGPSGAVAIQDPCHLRHAQRVVEEPRRVLRAGGYEVREIDPLGLCCGAAGMYTLLERDTSEELGRRKAAQILDSGSLVVASANPGCEMQLRTHLGSGFTIRHPIELYLDSLDKADS